MSRKEKVKKKIDEMDDQIDVWEAKIEGKKRKPKSSTKRSWLYFWPAMKAVSLPVPLIPLMAA